MTDDVLFNDIYGDKLTEDEFIRKWDEFKVFIHISTQIVEAAASKNWLKVAKLFIERGVDINKRDCRRFSPLDNAIRKKQTEFIDLLIESGAEVTYDNCELMFLNGKEIASELINRKNEAGDTFLMIAACRGDIDFVKYLVNKGANINETDRAGHSVIEYTGYVINKFDYYSLDNCTQTLRFLVGQRIKTVAVIFRHLPQYIILWITDWFEESDSLKEYEKINFIEKVQRRIMHIKNIEK